MCIIANIAKYAYVIGGNSTAPYTVSYYHRHKLIYHYSFYIYTYCTCTILFFLQVPPYVTYNIYFQRLVPATNTHITYVCSIYVLLIPILVTSNSF